MSAFFHWLRCILDPYSGLITAFATLWIAIFTIVLACVSRRQAKLISKQVELARDEFRATHRPKIVIRRCKLSSLDPSPDRKWRSKFIYHNEGDSPAYIREIGTRVFAWSKPSTYGDNDIRFNVVPITEIVKSGEDGVYFTGQDFDCNVTEPATWFFAGYVQYSDLPAGGAIRKVGFLRRWEGRAAYDLSTFEWHKESHEEYEYSY